MAELSGVEISVVSCRSTALQGNSTAFPQGLPGKPGRKKREARFAAKHLCCVGAKVPTPRKKLSTLGERSTGCLRVRLRTTEFLRHRGELPTFIWRKNGNKGWHQRFWTDWAKHCAHGD